MTGFVSAASIRRDVAGLARSRERISVSAGARKYVRLRNASGVAEHWNPAITPYMCEPLDRLGERRYEGVVFAGPARTGKTGGLLGWIGHVIKTDPSDMAIMSMTEKKAARFSKKELRRMLLDSPDLRAELSPSRHDDNTLAKYFRRGNVLYICGPSDTELRAETLKYFALTDYDGIVRNAGQEGSVFLRAKKRLQTMGSAAAIYAEGSPGFEIIDPRWRPSPEHPHEAPPVADGILPLYNQGTRCRCYLLCPVCGEHFIEPSSFEDGFSWEDEKDLFGVVVPELHGEWGLACSANGCVIGEEHEQTVKRTGIWVPEGCELRNGKVEGEPRDVPLASYWLLGPSAAYQRWRSLLTGYLQALSKYQLIGDEGDLMVAHNTDMGTAYLPQSKRVERDPGGLADRAESGLERGVVPRGVRFLTAEVDIQSGSRDPRFVAHFIGYGRDLESWIVDRREIRWSDKRSGERERVNPAAIAEHWDELLDQVILRAFPLEGDPGREMQVHLTAVDTGGSGSGRRRKSGQVETSVTDLAYRFWRRVKAKGLSHRLMLVKGASSQTAPIIDRKYPDNRRRKDRAAHAFGDVPVYMLNVHRLKDEVFNRIGRTERGPGYMHWPDWLPRAFYDELTAETRTPMGWEQDGSPNEAFDLYVYAAAACYRLKAERMDWNNPKPWASHWDENSEIREAREIAEASDDDVDPRPATSRPRRRRRYRFG